MVSGTGDIGAELLTTEELASWPQRNARDAQARFPELVRRLLQETPGATEVSFRTGDGVAYRGLDGTARMQQVSTVLPQGNIVFELGTNKDTKRKATEDHRKRAEDATNDKIFVFATPRRWSAKDEWVAETKRSSAFNQVIALDADDIHGWLQTAPQTHLWISEQLGKHPRDAQTLETWLINFSKATDPQLPPRLFLQGRGEQAKALCKYLNGTPNLFTIKARERDDILAFVAALLLDSQDYSDTQLQTAIIHSPEAWNTVTTNECPGILIPLFENPDYRRAIDNGRHVLVPVDDSTFRPDSVDIELPRVDRSGAMEVLLSANLGGTRARALSLVARHSTAALRRRMSPLPSMQIPTWAVPPLRDPAARLTLVGQWETESSADRALLVQVCDLSNEEIQQKINQLREGPDPLLRTTPRFEAFVSIHDALLMLHRQLDRATIEKWQEIVIKTLLPPRTDKSAKVVGGSSPDSFGHVDDVSETLRRGLARTMILLSSSDHWSQSHRHFLEATRTICRELMSLAFADISADTLVRVSEQFESLAEADPDTFLSTLDNDLSRSSPLLKRLFDPPQDNIVFLSSDRSHTTIAALEILSWSSEYLIRVVHALGRLTHFETRGSQAPGPTDSLCRVLALWVSRENRDLNLTLNAIRNVGNTNSDAAWIVLDTLWPGHTQLIQTPQEPYSREWSSWVNEGSPRAPERIASELSHIACDWTRRNPSECRSLIKLIPQSPTSAANEMLSCLEELRLENECDIDELVSIRESIRSAIVRAERVSGHAWHLSETQINRLRRIGEALDATDPVIRSAHLFMHAPHFPRYNHPDIRIDECKITSMRESALRDILTEMDPWAKIVKLAENIEAPWILGATLTGLSNADSEKEMLAWLKSESGKLQKASMGYFEGVMRTNGPHALLDLLDQNYPSRIVEERIALAVPPKSQFWRQLESFPHAKRRFWEHADLRNVQPTDVDEAITHLIENRKFDRALDVALGTGLTREHCAPQPVSDALIVRLLLLGKDAFYANRFCSNTMQFSIGRLIDYLAESDIGERHLAFLEWLYFPILGRYREPKVLHGFVEANPKLFAILIKRLSTTSRNLSRADLSRDTATILSTSVNDWIKLPGTKPDDSLNISFFLNWITAVRSELIGTRDLPQGDRLLGEILARSPVDDDGIWPSRPIRTFIEAAASEDLDEGVMVHLIYSRGISVRNVFSGGQPERDSSAKYNEWARAVEAEHFRTANILRRVARELEVQADREDEEAELRQETD